MESGTQLASRTATGDLQVKQRDHWRKVRDLLAEIATHLILMVFATLAFGALLWLVMASFKTASEIIRKPPTFWPDRLTLDNYVYILAEMSFKWYFANSVLVALPTITMVLFTSSITGFVFAKYQFPGREVLFTIILSTMMIPAAVTLLPLFQLVSRIGWADSYQALIIPASVSAFGIFLMRQFMESIPSDLIDAGRIDGASAFWIYARIIIPLSISPLSALGIFTFLGVWDSYLWPLVIIYSDKMRTLPLGLAYLLGWASRPRYDLFLTGAVITVVPVILFYSLAQQRFVRGVTLTGLKF
ncbi:MAG: carbohydrate ABC transporter permease [Anaerolineae bacterium]